MKEQSFIPPSRMLMGPGPSDVSARVLEAMARPTIGHLDPQFISMMDEIKKLLQYTFITSNELTFAVSAPGMAGMECCFANLVEENDKVIICKNGFFGERMKENVERFGGIPVVIDDEWGTKVDLNKIEEALKHTPVHKVWGVGRRLTNHLNNAGILTALDLANVSPRNIRKQFSVVLERTVRELKGQSCITLHDFMEPKKQIMVSRSFGKSIRDKRVLKEAISFHASRAAEKLRYENQKCRITSRRVDCKKIL